MTGFFNKLIGGVFTVSVETGKTLYTEVYGRTYKATLISSTDKGLLFNIVSKDYTPSG